MLTGALVGVCDLLHCGFLPTPLESAHFRGEENSFRCVLVVGQEENTPEQVALRAARRPRVEVGSFSLLRYLFLN